MVFLLSDSFEEQHPMQYWDSSVFDIPWASSYAAGHINPVNINQVIDQSQQRNGE